MCYHVLSMLWEAQAEGALYEIALPLSRRHLTLSRMEQISSSEVQCSVFPRAICDLNAISTGPFYIRTT
jgi:hypothetical protein